MQCCGLGKKSKVASEPTETATKAAPAVTNEAKPQPSAPVTEATPATAMADAPKAKIAVVYYSTYGHVARLAKEELEGINSVEGVEGHLFQIPETLPAEVLEKMHAPPKDKSVPVMDVHQLPDFDGILFGIPTRYGMPAAQFKAFLDATGGLWQKGALAGKTGGFFFSTASQGGGQETTALTGYTEPTGLQFGLDEVQGGSPYGAGTFAGPTGARQPTETELKIAKHQGQWFAGITKKVAGK